jgi:hypothetical protein
MKELNIEEMTWLRGGQALDISNSLNQSNVAAVLSLGNTATAAPANLSVGSQGNTRQVATANAGNQSVLLLQ